MVYGWHLGVEVGGWHALWELWDGSVLFVIQEPTYRPPHIHVYGRNRKEFHAYFVHQNGLWSCKFNKGFAESDLARITDLLGYENRTQTILKKVAEVLARQEGRQVIDDE